MLMRKVWKRVRKHVAFRDVDGTVNELSRLFFLVGNAYLLPTMYRLRIMIVEYDKIRYDNKNPRFMMYAVMIKYYIWL